MPANGRMKISSLKALGSAIAGWVGEKLGSFYLNDSKGVLTFFDSDTILSRDLAGFLVTFANICVD